MSTMRKALKILSFLSIIAAVDLAITAWVLNGSDGGLEPLQIVTMILSVAFALILGVMGIGAANRPSKAKSLFLVVLLSMWVNIGNLLLLALEGEFVVSVLICALISFAYAYAAHMVNKESQQL